MLNIQYMLVIQLDRGLITCTDKPRDGSQCVVDASVALKQVLSRFSCDGALLSLITPFSTGLMKALLLI